jgi:hypothetical protein
MRPHAQPSDTEEGKWRAEFEKLGRETVRVAIYRGQGMVALITLALILIARL